MTRQAQTAAETVAGRRLTSALRANGHGGLHTHSRALLPLAVAVGLEQAIRRCGRRHVPSAPVSHGGSPLVPAALDRWPAGHLASALIDLLRFTCNLAEVLILGGTAAFVLAVATANLAVRQSSSPTCGWWRPGTSHFRLSVSTVGRWRR
jgi:hypothetical protein